MKQAIDAIYESGVFRPLQPDAIAVPEGQRVRITVDDQGEPDALRLALRVYDGLSSEEVEQVERIALDRSNFFARRSAD